jgi:ParB-like chromosome segregation protein Spo0J
MDTTTSRKVQPDEVERIMKQMDELAEQLPWNHPVKTVRWVPIENVRANDYNPNAVAQEEMRLLHTSIAEDGYTQPVVAIVDEEGSTPERTLYVIVDGFHRFTTMKRYQDIYDTTGGYLPVVVLHKTLEDRIAATVRHNRARGKHSVAGMGNLVFEMLNQGASDETIIQKVGLDPEELARLKHVTGYSKLFEMKNKDKGETPEYSRVVMTGSQLQAKADFKKENPDEHVRADF